MEDENSLHNLLSAIDYLLIISVLAVYAIGVATIYSAAGGSERLGEFYASRQLIWGGVACVAFAVTLRLDFEFLFEKSYWIYGACCALLFFLLIAGRTVKGAQSWIDLGAFRVQPAEFAKLGLAFAMAKFLTQFPPTNVKNFLFAIAIGGVSLLLVVLQPDLGSALVFCVVIFVSLLVAGTPRQYLLSLVGAGAVTLPFGWLMLKSYQKNRILVFLNPELDPLGAGYNVIQSRIAVGSGHFWGKGFLQGAQSKLRFLPEPHTDFIFSVYAEEFGLVGCFVLLFLLAFIIWRLLRIALLSRNVSSKILIAALAASFWFHCFESIGMCMGLLPVTGLPLPLMSYGGSSLLSTILTIAIAVKLGANDELLRRMGEVG